MAKRILLVDDEPLILKGLKYTLEQEGYETDSAMDGEEALAKFFGGQYDMILLDVMLPKLDGISVCQRIREHSNVPIIMLTAKGEDMDKILGLEYGADDYMTKPYNILEVKARIKTIFRRVHAAGRPGRSKDHPGTGYAGQPGQAHGHPRGQGRKAHRQGIRPATALHPEPGKGIQPGGHAGNRMEI